MKKEQKELEEAWEALSPAQRDSMRADEQKWEAQNNAEPFQIRLQSITNRAAWLWHLADNKARAMIGILVRNISGNTADPAKPGAITSLQEMAISSASWLRRHTSQIFLNDSFHVVLS